MKKTTRKLLRAAVANNQIRGVYKGCTRGMAVHRVKQKVWGVKKYHDCNIQKAQHHLLLLQGDALGVKWLVWNGFVSVAALMNATFWGMAIERREYLHLADTKYVFLAKPNCICLRLPYNKPLQECCQLMCQFVCVCVPNVICFFDWHNRPRAIDGLVLCSSNTVSLSLSLTFSPFLSMLHYQFSIF